MTRWTDAQYRAHQHRTTPTRPSAGAAHQSWKDREAANAVPPGPRAFTVQIPFPPSVNALYCTDPKTGAKHLRPEQRAFRQDVAGVAAIARLPQLTGPLEFRMELRPSQLSRSDADAGIKATLDALQHAGAFANDRQIKSIRVDMREPIEGYPAHAVVTVSEIEGTP